jgi:hypothetical protein
MKMKTLQSFGTSIKLPAGTGKISENFNFEVAFPSNIS